MGRGRRTRAFISSSLSLLLLPSVLLKCCDCLSVASSVRWVAKGEKRDTQEAEREGPLSLVAEGLTWSSLDHLCHYRCSSGASSSYLSYCQEHCELVGGGKSEEREKESQRRLVGDGERETEWFFCSCNGQKLTLKTEAEHPFKELVEALETYRGVELKEIEEREAEESRGEKGEEEGSRKGCVFPTSGISLPDQEKEETIRVYLLRLFAGQSVDGVEEILRSLSSSPPFLRYVPNSESVYVVSLTEKERDSLRRSKSVLSLFVLPPFYRISSSLLSALKDADAASLPSINVYLDKRAGVPASVFAEAANTYFESTLGIKVLFSLSSSKRLSFRPLENAAYLLRILQDLAATRGVDLIETAPTWHLFRDREALFFPTIRSGERAERQSWRRRLDVDSNALLGLPEAHKMGLDGSGVVATCSDSGVYMYHDQFLQQDIPYRKVDKTQRKVILYLPQKKGNEYDSSDAANDTCGHGTHVCAALAGASASGQPNLGAAPGAKVAVYDIGGDKTAERQSVPIEPPQSVSETFGPFNETGSRVFSFSWGSEVNPEYDLAANNFDRFLYENPDFIVFFAIGNFGGRSAANKNCAGGQIASPAHAKNVISVGASVNVFPEGSCEAYHPSAVAHFSSVGPAPGGRRKPDILCPGHHVTSAMSLSRESFEKKETTSSTCVLSGTSQACPTCAGAGVLIYQWLTEGRWKSGAPDNSLAIARPLSSLVKALLVFSGQALSVVLPDPASFKETPTCADLKTHTRPTVLGDNFQGFGLVNLPSVLGLGTNGLPFVMTPDNAITESLKTGEKKTYSLSWKGLGKKEKSYYFRAVLSWTDPAPAAQDLTGSKCNPMIVNDLDLSVFVSYSNGTTATYLPFNVKGERAIDRGINNVEVVQIPPPESGVTAQFTITVSAFNVNGTGGQVFSLVAGGLESVSVPVGDSDKNSISSTSAEWIIYVAVAGSVCMLAIAIVLTCCSRKRSRARKQLAAVSLPSSSPRPFSSLATPHSGQSRNSAGVPRTPAGLMGASLQPSPYVGADHIPTFSPSPAVDQSRRSSRNQPRDSARRQRNGQAEIEKRLPSDPSSRGTSPAVERQSKGLAVSPASTGPPRPSPARSPPASSPSSSSRGFSPRNKPMAHPVAAPQLSPTSLTGPSIHTLPPHHPKEQEGRMREEKEHAPAMKSDAENRYLRAMSSLSEPSFVVGGRSGSTVEL